MAAEDYIGLEHLHSDDVEEFLGGDMGRNYFGHKEIPEAPRHGHAWKENEKRVLKSAVKNKLPWEEAARVLKRTPRACQMMADQLGLSSENVPAVAIQSKELSVNDMHLITLMQEGYTTVTVTLTEHDSYTQVTKFKTYTYKAPIEMGLAAGDKVVVYAREKLVIATVKEVHAEPQVDFTAPYALKWVVQKVDLADHDEQRAREAAALSHLNSVKRKRQKEELLKDLFGSEAGVEELKALLNK